MEHFIEGSAQLRLSLTGLFLKKDTKVSKMFEFSNLKCQISKIFQLNLEKHTMHDVLLPENLRHVYIIFFVE